jgi:hypothetical protein
MKINAISGTHSLQIADSATNLYEAGYLGVPQNAQSANYQLVLADRGKNINLTTATLTVTVPPSVFSAGDSITVVNATSGTQTLAQGTSVTLRLAGSAVATGNRSMAAWSVATLLCVTGGATPTFFVCGPGVT